MPVANNIKNMLWGNAGGICSFPECNEILSKDGSNIGEICHIIPQKPNGPRGEFKTNNINVDSYDNLILMCQKHHKIIDDQPEIYHVDQLKSYRAEHETMVRGKLNNVSSFYDDLVFNFGIKIQELGFDWLHSLPEADWALKIDKYYKLYSLIEWISSRDWMVNNSNAALEYSFKKLSESISQVLATFKIHSIIQGDCYATEKFYKSVDFCSKPELREQLQNQYDEHIDKLTDLTIEVAKNFNKIFRTIRKSIDGNFLSSFGIIQELHGVELV